MGKDTTARPLDGSATTRVSARAGEWAGGGAAAFLPPAREPPPFAWREKGEGEMN